MPKINERYLKNKLILEMKSLKFKIYYTSRYGQAEERINECKGKETDIIRLKEQTDKRMKKNKA